MALQICKQRLSELKKIRVELNRNSMEQKSCTFLLLVTIAASTVSTLINVTVTKDSGIILQFTSPFNSPPVLKTLAEKDSQLYDKLKYLVRHSESLDKCEASAVSGYTKHYERAALKLNVTEAARSQEVAWNPIATFQMLARMAAILRPVLAAVESDSVVRLTIDEVMKDIGVPSFEHLRQSASSILRIQHVYDLNTADISAGQLLDAHTGLKLSPWDCNFIGEQALTLGYFALAVEWFQHALNLISTDNAEVKDVLKIDAGTLAKHLQGSIQEHNGNYRQSQSWDARFFVEPVASDSNRTRRRTTEYERWMSGDGDDSYNTKDLIYWGVCSGENYQSEEDRAQLFCYYEKQQSLAFIINPVKVELLALQPIPVFQYHDLIGPKMIDNIKTEASGALKQAHIEGDKNNNGVRSSLHTWIDEDGRPDYKSFVRNIEHLTGLKVESRSAAEMLQVAAYSAGSHYSVHFDALGADAFTEEEYGVNLGDRIATFLFYLSDVQKGGGTAFIGAGIAAQPIKGSAVLWYNLKRSAEIDGYSLHAACPVVSGEKWITNKWIHSNDQMFSKDFQCSLDPEALVGLRTNGVPTETYWQ